MKKVVRISVVVMAVLLMSVMAGHAHVHGGIWIGPVWGPGWWGPPYPYYPYYAPPPVVVQQPSHEIYVQPEPQSEEPSYWYFCPNPQGYYPYVQQCPNGWMKVVPSPPQQRKE